MEEYIIAACYKKMKLRVSHWSSRAYLHRLSQFKSRDNFQTWYRAYVNANPSWHIPEAGHEPKDTKFWKNTQSYLEAPAGVDECPFYENVPEFTALRAVMKQNDTPSHKKYTVETCYEFHQLLVITLSAFFTKLHRFDHAVNKNSEPSQIRDKAHHFRNIVYVLWGLVESRVFVWHLRLLSAHAGLEIPTFSDAQHLRISEEGHLTVKGHPVPFGSSEPSGTAGSGDNYNGADGDPGLLTGDISYTPGQAKHESVQEAYRQWGRLHASHFQALQVIKDMVSELIVIGSDASLSYELFQTESRKHAPVNGWEQTIRTACKARPQENPDDLIQALRRALNRVSIDTPEAATNQQVFHLKNSNGIDRFDFLGAVHCEAELACILLSRGVTKPMIAVSKRCCPVCWDYLENCHKRNRHNLLFPIELPAHTPDALFHSLEATYNSMLIDNLVKLKRRQSVPLPNKRAQTISISSGVTAATHMSADDSATYAEFDPPQPQPEVDHSQPGESNSQADNF